MPNVTMTFDGVDYVLTPEDYVVQVAINSRRNCANIPAFNIGVTSFSLTS